VTAGPTEEPIDEVRFIGNRSSGRMGGALARAFADLGCPVTLLLGPVRTEPPTRPDIRIRRFRTAADLADLLAAALPDHEVLVMAAAVADFRPVRAVAGKLAREGPLRLDLEPVPDLLAGLPPRGRGAGLRIGFALEEPASLRERARGKLARKDLDAIVANPLSAMDADAIDGTLLWRDGSEERAGDGAVGKDDFARFLAGRIVARAGAAFPRD